MPHEHDQGRGHGHEHGDEAFPRQLTAELVGEAEAARRAREALPVWLLGIGLAVLALGLPSERIWGHLRYLPAAFDGRSQPYAALGWVARQLTATTGLGAERAWYLLAAVPYGACLPALVGLLRAVGFERGPALVAALVALFAPLAWVGATLPAPFAAALLGSTLLARVLFTGAELSRSHYAGRAVAVAGFLVTVDPAGLWLGPALVWAIATHRPRRAAPAPASARRGVAWWALAVLAGLAFLWAWPGVDAVRRTLLAGQGGGPGVLLLWGLWAVLGLGACGFGLWQLFLGRRSPEESAPPSWLVPWCAVALLPMLAGSPVGSLTGAQLLPAAALGLADWMARQEREERALQRGGGLLAAQLALCALVAALFAYTDPEREWRALARRELEPQDVVLTTSEFHLYLLQRRWGVRSELFPPAFFDAREQRWLAETEPDFRAAAARGSRVFTDGERAHFPAVALRFAAEVGARPLGGLWR